MLPALRRRADPAAESRRRPAAGAGWIVWSGWVSGSAWPVVAVGAGVAVGALCFEKEAFIALFALVGLALGFALVFAADKILSGSRGFGMEVVEICDTKTKDTEEGKQSGQNV